MLEINLDHWLLWSTQKSWQEWVQKISTTLTWKRFLKKKHQSSSRWLLLSTLLNSRNLVRWALRTSSSCVFIQSCGHWDGLYKTAVSAALGGLKNSGFPHTGLSTCSGYQIHPAGGLLPNLGTWYSHVMASISIFWLVVVIILRYFINHHKLTVGSVIEWWKKSDWLAFRPGQERQISQRLNSWNVLMS